LNIKTIIFDLGGVIIDLHECKTIEQFARLSGKDFTEIENLLYEDLLFKNYETGLIRSPEFRAGLNALLATDLTDDQIDQAWNAMLGEIPIERLTLLKQLRQHYQVVILSNTNAIHVMAFNGRLMKICNEPTFESFTDLVFFSHLLKLRKPDPAVFLKALELSKTKATEALFLDDKLDNLRTAQSLGMETIHIESPDQIFKLRKYVNG